jgi:hypothetical protein
LKTLVASCFLVSWTLAWPRVKCLPPFMAVGLASNMLPAVAKTATAISFCSRMLCVNVFSRVFPSARDQLHRPLRMC